MSKQLFGPMPLRAMALDLSGLDMRVLLCVAAHDRMSLSTSKGQGCRASNERMRQMIGCHYAALCKSLSKLVALDLLQREPMGRHTVYRVVYTEADMLLFGNMSRPSGCNRLLRGQTASDPPEMGCQTASEDAATCCQGDLSSGAKLPETASQYIPLNGRNTFCETGEENSSEEARFARCSPERTPFSENPGGQMARLERALSVGQLVDRLAWYQYLEEQVGDENPSNSGRATRLADQLIEGMNEEEYAEWGLAHGWVDDEGHWHCAHPRQDNETGVHGSITPERIAARRARIQLAIAA